MNKKFLFGAALVGILGFGSCVDNNESPSVTNIREAKAEQLRALGNAAEIEAEARKLAAEGEKSLNEALAAVERAREAQINAQTQQDAAMAAVQLQEAQERLKQTIAANEIALEQLKVQLKLAQANYERQLLQNDTEKRSLLTSLYNDYKTATSNLLNDQESLTNTQNTLAKLEAKIIDTKEANLAQIARERKSIIGYQNQIAEAEASIKTLQENLKTTLPELQVKLTTAESELEQLQVPYDKVLADSETAEEVRDNAQKQLENSIYVNDLHYFLREGYYEPFFDFGVVIAKVGAEIPYWFEVLSGQNYGWWGDNIPGFVVNGRDVVQWGDWVMCVYDSEKNTWSFKTLVTDYQVWQQRLPYPAEEGQVPDYTGSYNVLSGYQYQADGFKAFYDTMSANVNENIVKPYNDNKKVYDEAVTAQAAAQKKADEAATALATAKDNQKTALANKEKADADVTAAQKALTEAQKGTDAAAITAAQNALTAAQTAQSNAASEVTKIDNAVSAAQTAATNATSALSAAQTATGIALTELNRSEDQMKGAQTSLASYKEKIDVIGKQLVNFNKYMTSYNEAGKAYAQAEIDVVAPKAAYESKNAEIEALNELIANNGDEAAINAQISTLEDNIITLNENIVNAKQQIAKLENPEETSDYGQTVEQLKNQIAKLQQKVAVDQELVDAAKKALEDATNAE